MSHYTPNTIIKIKKKLVFFRVSLYSTVWHGIPYVAQVDFEFTVCLLQPPEHRDYSFKPLHLARFIYDCCSISFHFIFFDVSALTADMDYHPFLVI
jgi:hypothetical protein